MASPTAVNSQITDAITQSNVKVIGESAAVALSNLYQATSSALATSIQNATFAQQQSNMIYQSVTTQGVNLIYAVDTEAVGDVSEKISRADTQSNVLNDVLMNIVSK
jgi:phosphoenolpyruvate synthase/pyruvate phosphate dikinase